MRLFFAGSDGSKPYDDLLWDEGVQDRLVSYWTLLKRSRMDRRFNLLLDSGGFSARNSGAVIDVETYAAFVESQGFKVAFNLDTSDPKETLDNQRYLQEHTSAYIIPVYHFSDFDKDDRELVDQWVRDGYPLISVGGVVGANLTDEQAEAYLNYVFSRTRDTVPVHGLGITTPQFTHRYPFYSADSTTWLQFGRYGRCTFLPDGDPRRKVLRSTQDHLERSAYEIRRWQQRRDQATQVWDARGVHWPDTLDIAFNGKSVML